MKLAVLKERQAGETRVAISPQSIKKYLSMGIEIAIESGAGLEASFSDAAYEAAGAQVVQGAQSAMEGAALVLKIRGPEVMELDAYPKGIVLAASMNALSEPELMDAYAQAGITAFAMELIPRISRAQSMDILSSQANLAGYKAVLEGCGEYGRAFPMMMTAAGTIPPAKVFIMGVGVAGLQAIATARRLGAVVSATDVRPATKEQVESLGASFVAVEDEEFKQAETSGGYAKDMSDEYKAKQAELVAQTIKKQDMVITTALIPGRKAPVLVTKEMVDSMKPGAVLVDLAAEQGGNVAGAVPGEVIVTQGGVKIIGARNLPGRLAEDASNLFAKNLLAFVSLLYDEEKKALSIDLEDEIIKGCLVVKDMQVVHPGLKKGE